jgi:Trypsin-like peptidase domain
MLLGNTVLALARIDKQGRPIALAGNAFPVLPDGGLLTCEHLLRPFKDGGKLTDLAVFDSLAQAWHPVTDVIYPSDSTVDLALLPKAIRQSSPVYFPLLGPAVPPLGEDVYSVGYLGDHNRDGRPRLDPHHFRGSLVSPLPDGPRSRDRGHPSWKLSFPVLSGMSGSPLLTCHNGIKLIGICYSNEEGHILAHSISETEDDGRVLREEIHRIVEYGAAYQTEVLEAFLAEAAPGGYIVSDQKVAIDGLD